MLPRYLFTFLFFRLTQGALIPLDRDFPVFILAIRRLDSTYFTSFRIAAAARAALTRNLASSSVSLCFSSKLLSFSAFGVFFIRFLLLVLCHLLRLQDLNLLDFYQLNFSSKLTLFLFAPVIFFKLRNNFWPYIREHLSELGYLGYHHLKDKYLGKCDTFLFHSYFLLFTVCAWI